jgi:hypothetical protein
MRRLNQASARATVAWVALLNCALVATALVAHAAKADSLPPSVAACAAEHDIGKRLACYDREVARFAPVSPGAEVKAATVVAPGNSGVASGTQPAAEPAHIAASIVSIESYADEIVLHLSNGQIWQQVQAAEADPNLHPGDAVTIDRSLGSYWLSGRSGIALKVRRRQ